MSTTTPPKAILILSIRKHLTGKPISEAIAADWAKPKASGLTNSFTNAGFDLDPDDAPNTMRALRSELEGRPWDAVIIGWCVRGHVEFTEFFEEVVSLCVLAREKQEPAGKMKLLFSTGQGNLVETTLRGFPVVGVA
ncbi:hypothetical protein B0O99DRAFT_690956 [Bisporella sp. PMI_857]|nr:hypothetical protein B0O99DRAFT_690956 [Bisporella sp. PMI_857]